MRILAMYLPQFHEIEENNRWWGQGYTEWTAVKNAKKYFSLHQQPRIPLNNNYYDLSDQSGSVWKWQADLAKKYGVYGFCIYHYWFKTGNQLLEKPMEILLHHPEIDINYCICWANETWKRTWYSVKREILKEQEYGNQKEWENHFNYLLQFFKDRRYIKINNKPVINIYHSYDIPQLNDMRQVWDNLACKNGFDGVYLVVGNTGAKQREVRTNAIDAYYNYEPGNTINHIMSKRDMVIKNMRHAIKQFGSIILKHKRIPCPDNAKTYYKYTNQLATYSSKKCYLGTFSAYDDTPRRQYKGSIIQSTPKDFYDNLMQIKLTLHALKRDDDFVYITAWNEWGEGAYLEPDTINQYKYLEAIKEVMKD
jgi:lipopolysaccharide biosynthesis protein